MAYVYKIIIDGTVRYIGKGTGNRPAMHMKMVRKIARQRAAGEAVKTTHFYNRLTKAWLSGSQIEFAVVVDGLSDIEAFDCEKAEIAVSSGLWNTAPGGEGYSSDQWSDPEFRNRMKMRDSKRITSEKWRKDQSETLAFLWQHPEFKELRAKKRWSPEQRAAFGEWMKERWADPSMRAEMTERNRQQAIEQWRDPEKRKRLMESLRLSRRAKKAIGELL